MGAIRRVFSVTPKILPLRALDPPEHNRSQCISTGPSSSYSVDRGASHLSSSEESLGQVQRALLLVASKTLRLRLILQLLHEALPSKAGSFSSSHDLGRPSTYYPIVTDTTYGFWRKLEC
uniref:Uncharacterized protein n=1 Tax=Bionectria ochroleuca TaxID=29856 RepID=A0A0B7JSV7_BIOOC